MVLLITTILATKIVGARHQHHHHVEANPKKAANECAPHELLHHSLFERDVERAEKSHLGTDCE